MSCSWLVSLGGGGGGGGMACVWRERALRAEGRSFLFEGVLCPARSCLFSTSSFLSIRPRRPSRPPQNPRCVLGPLAHDNLEAPASRASPHPSNRWMGMNHSNHDALRRPRPSPPPRCPAFPSMEHFLLLSPSCRTRSRLPTWPHSSSGRRWWNTTDFCERGGALRAGCVIHCTPTWQ